MALASRIFFNYFKLNSNQILKRGMSINKDLVTNKQSSDLLLHYLKTSTDTKNILDLVDSHHNIMNEKHVMQALRSLFFIQKNEKSTEVLSSSINNAKFEKLCRKLKVYAGIMEQNEVIEALKVLSFLKVPSNSTIMQILLQLIRHNVNDLNIPQIIFVDFILHQFKSSPLVEALKIALPIIFEAQLNTKMDREDLNHIAEYLHYASKRPVSEKCIEMIVASAIRCKSEMDVKTANSFIWSICDMKPDVFFEPILLKSFDVLRENIEGLSYSEMETTISKLIKNYSNRFPFYYNEAFFDACGNYVIENNLSFTRAMHVVKKFNYVGYYHKKLIDYFTQKLVENSDLLLNASLPQISDFIFAIGLIEAKPPQWEVIKEHFTKNDININSDHLEFLVLRLALSFAVLEIYKVNLYKHIFNPTALEKFSKNQKNEDVENIILLSEAIKTFQSDLVFILPASSYYESLIVNLRRLQEYPLEIYLQKCLGGNQYLKSGVFTELGMHIDHIVVLKKDGSPLRLNEQSDILEKFEVPTENKILLFLVLKPQHFVLNFNVMKSFTLLKIKILESKGYTVVPLFLNSEKELNEYDYVPYLTQVIREKSESLVAVKNETQ